MLQKLLGLRALLDSMLPTCDSRSSSKPLSHSSRRLFGTRETVSGPPGATSLFNAECNGPGEEVVGDALVTARRTSP
jgi:hypothetical protein